MYSSNTKISYLVFNFILLYIYVSLQGNDNWALVA